MLRKNITLIIILLIISHLLSSQNKPKFKHITTHNGFSGGWVKYIYKDSKGYMWFCSNYGLNRYNGYEFTVFFPNDKVKHSLSHNNTTSILEDSNGNIWIGTLGGGINMYRPQTNDFINFQTKELDTFGIHGNSVYSLCEDRLGYIWIGTFGDGVNRYDRKSGRFYQYLHSKVDTNTINDNTSTSIIEDSEGVIWAATYGKGIHRYNRDKDNFTRINIPGEQMLTIPSWLGKTLFEDSDKNLWIGTESEGVFYWDKNKNIFTHYSETTNGNHLSGNIITSITEDNEGQNLDWYRSWRHQYF
jgi:ligand-binding sensor domain-containing protein